MAFIETGVLQAGQVRGLRWADHDDVSAAGNNSANCRRQQAPLRNRGLGLKDLGQGVARPTSAGEFGVEYGEARTWVT